MSEQDAIDKAQAAVSDDTIVAASWFLPRGFSGGSVGGMTLGGAVGGALGGGLGQAIGSAAGLVGGIEAEKHHDDAVVAATDGAEHRVPWNALVAASATRLYGWRTVMEGVHRAAGEPLFVYDREHLAVTVHARLSVRTFEVRDETTGTTWEFESPRINGHLGPLLDALHADH